jgi:hypothetical protein
LRRNGVSPASADDCGVVSKTFIEAKVLSGATTGTVQVKLPSGTLFSNVPFVVLN